MKQAINFTQVSIGLDFDYLLVFISYWSLTNDLVLV